MTKTKVKASLLNNVNLWKRNAEKEKEKDQFEDFLMYKGMMQALLLWGREVDIFTNEEYENIMEKVRWED